MKEFDSICIPGERHLREKIPCQDSVFSAKCGNVSAIALSDGAGGDAMASIGAGTTAATAAQYFAEHFDELWGLPEEEIRYRLLSRIRCRLFHLGETADVEFSAFGSTCIAAAVDEKKRLLLAHLGDGRIFGQTETGFRVLSAPENGITAEYTYLTTSIPDSEAMRVLKLSAADCRRIFLASDGYAFGTPQMQADPAAYLTSQLDDTTPGPDDRSIISMTVRQTD